MKSKMRHKLIESLFGNVGTVLLNLFLPYVVTTIYGAHLLGVYTYNLSIIFMFIFVASLGLSTGLVYYIPRSGNKYVTSSLLINVFISGFLIIIGFFVFKDYDMRIMLVLLWPLSAEFIFKALFQSKQQIKEYFLVNLLVHQGTKILLAYILGSYFGPSITNLVIATYVSIFLAIIIYTLMNLDMFGPVHFSKALIKYSLPLSISNMLFVVMLTLDRVMIGWFHAEEAVAVYAVAARIATIPAIFLSILNTVFPPIISKLYHEGHVGELKRIYDKSVKVLTLISSITIAIIIIFRAPLLNLYGPEYVIGGTALIMIAVGQLVNASVGSVWFTVAMTGHSDWSMYGKIVSFIINASLNIILIPSWGITGAAFATMISTAFSNILGYFLVKNIFNKALKQA